MNAKIQGRSTGIETLKRLTFERSTTPANFHFPLRDLFIRMAVLELLDIRVADAPGTEPAALISGGTPRSSYGVRAINSPMLVLRAVTVQAGRGEDGYDRFDRPSTAAGGGAGGW